jgi:hypothetical protein
LLCDFGSLYCGEEGVLVLLVGSPWWGRHGGVAVRGRWVVEKNFGARFLLSAMLVSTIWPVGYQDTAKYEGYTS